MKTDAAFFEAVEWVREKEGRSASRDVDIFMSFKGGALVFTDGNKRKHFLQTIDEDDLDHPWTLHPVLVKYREIEWEEALRMIAAGKDVERYHQAGHWCLVQPQHSLWVEDIIGPKWRIKIEDGKK